MATRQQHGVKMGIALIGDIKGDETQLFHLCTSHDNGTLHHIHYQLPLLDTWTIKKVITRSVLDDLYALITHSPLKTDTMLIQESDRVLSTAETLLIP